MKLRENIAEACAVLSSLEHLEPTVREASRALVDALASGHRILTCGNGGSAAEAMHLSTELVGRYEGDRDSLPAIFLGGDATLMSCIANDYGYDEIFARALRGHGHPGDVLVAFTTSGKSPNVVRALETARELGLESIALLGKGGGACRGLATWELIVDSKNTARIQEAHQLLLHHLCDDIERAFAGTPSGAAAAD